MTPYLAEYVGTPILILLGNGVVANVVLNHSKGRNGGLRFALPDHGKTE